jgi:hypothetical protein
MRFIEFLKLQFREDFLSNLKLCKHPVKVKIYFDQNSEEFFLWQIQNHLFRRSFAF